MIWPPIAASEISVPQNWAGEQSIESYLNIGGDVSDTHGFKIGGL